MFVLTKTNILDDTSVLGWQEASLFEGKHLMEYKDVI